MRGPTRMELYREALRVGNSKRPDILIVRRMKRRFLNGDGFAKEVCSSKIWSKKCAKKAKYSTGIGG